MMEKKQFMKWTLESTIRIILLLLLSFLTFLIFKPFLVLFVWSIIISISLYPLFKRFKKLFKGKEKISAIFISLITLALIIIPAILFLDVLIESISNFSDELTNGTFKIPSPPKEVSDWPIIGKGISNIWQLSSTNLETAFEKFGPQIKEFGSILLNSIGGLIGSIFMFIGAVILAAVFFMNAKSGYKFSIDLADKLVGANGEKLIKNSIATIQSVVKGVFGVAIIQTTLISIGFLVADIPGAPILIVVTLILSLVQIPASLIVIPVIVYVFSIESTTFSVIFMVYSLIAGLSDNFLKPILLGRGLDIPMLVILIGSIGGMILMGIVGLFVGPVIFALLYQLFMNWINDDKKKDPNSITT